MLRDQWLWAYDEFLRKALLTEQKLTFNMAAEIATVSEHVIKDVKKMKRHEYEGNQFILHEKPLRAIRKIWHHKHMTQAGYVQDVPFNIHMESAEHSTTYAEFAKIRAITQIIFIVPKEKYKLWYTLSLKYNLSFKNQT